MTMAPRDVVAVIDTTPDTIDLLKDTLEKAGFLVVTTYTWLATKGEVDLEAFLRTHQPAVILYDIARPCERNWVFLQTLRQTVFKDYRFVLTTPNVKQVERLMDRGDERVYEVVGHSDDLGQIVTAVREAAKARPTR